MSQAPRPEPRPYEPPAGVPAEVGAGTGTPRIPSEIWVLVVAAFAIAIGYGIVSPVLPAYARSFDVGVTLASVIVSAFAFCRLLFAPVSGVLIEKLGERRVYLGGLIIVAVSSLATAFAQTYWQLLVFRGLGGVGSTMFTVSAMALVVRLAPLRIRGRVSSLWGSSFIIGGMVGPLLGGLLAGLGMRAPFVIYAGTLAVAALVVGIGLSGSRLRPAPEAADQPVMTLARAWSDPAYRAALICGVANGWGNLGVRNTLLPLLAAVVFDRPWAAGVVLAVGAVGTAASLQVSGRLADSRGRRPLILAGMTITGVSMAAMGTALLPGMGAVGGLVVLTVLSLAGGIGAGLFNPAEQAAMADIVGSGRNGGRVLSTYQMAQDGGVIVGPVLVGLVADLAGFPGAFLVAGLVCLTGAAAWLFAPETLGRDTLAARRP